MNILLITIGSRGDVQPYVALGKGLKAAGLHAGHPTVVCSFIADQPDWGQRVYALRVGTESIPQNKLTLNA